MKTKPRGRGRLAAGLGLLLAAAGGCQTWVPETGQTLPSGWYLQHPPQYIPPSPRFPLPRELAHLEDAAAQPGPVAPRPFVPGAAGPVVVPAPAVQPAPVPPQPAPVPQPP
jgi:hypothetical protein